jgi:hypothetical protein
MEPMQEEVIAALQKDDWALALEVLTTVEAFGEPRYRLEQKYEMDIGDVQRLALLPAFEFKRFKRDAVRAVEKRLHAINHDLYQKLCIDLKYCERRDMPQARLISYLIGILDIIFGAGAIALAVLIAKREYMDKVCNCPREV